jgi:pimeloyl-ACP methyl ester carboxylesterase
VTLDRSEALLPGPWEHREIAANGLRFHAAEAGDGPLVLLLHGFPENWWAWRHQLPTLAAAGYRAVALDLRGYGATDHPPRGYDLPSLTQDVSAVIRSLGSEDAVVVGHDWGGAIGWSLACLSPMSVRRLVAVSSVHPRRLRTSVLTRFRQLRSSAYSLPFQAPWLPERSLVRDHASLVEELMKRWAAPGWRDNDALAYYRNAMQIENTAYCAMEYYRWAVRSMVRPDGLQYVQRMATPVQAPVLQLQGACDGRILPTTARGSGEHVAAAYRFQLLDGVGNFPHEEAPQRFDDALLGWLADPEPDR